MTNNSYKLTAKELQISSTHATKFDITQFFYSSTIVEIDPLKPFKKTIGLQIYAILLIILVIVATTACLYWLYVLWGHREMRAYKTAIKIRRPKYILLSYMMILPWIFLHSASTNELYWDNKTFYCNAQNEPIIYSPYVDKCFHFLFWFGFWSFVQLNIFRIWMIRYDCEYSREMMNIEWKDHLGMRTIQPISCFIRYRNILGNTFLMFFSQIVLSVIILFIQIFIRLFPTMKDNPSAAMWEQIFIWIVLTVEFCGIVKLTKGIRLMDDNYHLKAQMRLQMIVTGIAFFCWITGLIIYQTTYAYVVVQIGIAVFMIWLFIFCYVETTWLLKRINEKWTILQHMNHNMDHNMGYHNDRLKLSNVLQYQDGFEAMMQFLVKEFSCENLLCFVECSQYICAWVTLGQLRRKYKMLVSGYLKLKCNDYLLNMPQEIENMIIVYYLRLYIESKSSAKKITKNNSYLNSIDDENIIEMSEFICGVNMDMVDEFKYFENPEFDDDIAHYEYLMQKYFYDSACLQVNISGSLRQQIQQCTPGADTEFYLKILNEVRSELWSLLRDSFARFRATNDYRLFCQTYKQFEKEPFETKKFNLL